MGQYPKRLRKEVNPMSKTMSLIDKCEDALWFFSGAGCIGVLIEAGFPEHQILEFQADLHLLLAGEEE